MQPERLPSPVPAPPPTPSGAAIPIAGAVPDRLAMTGANARSLLEGSCAHLVTELRALGACQQAEARKLVVDGLRRVQPVAVPVPGSVIVAQAIPIAVHIAPVLVAKPVAVLAAAVSRRARTVALTAHKQC